MRIFYKKKNLLCCYFRYFMTFYGGFFSALSSLLRCLFLKIWGFEKCLVCEMGALKYERCCRSWEDLYKNPFFFVWMFNAKIVF